MEHVLTTTSRLLRQHDCLLIDCDLSQYLIDYYLNIKDTEPKPAPEHDAQLKQLIACLSLHLSIRPPEEVVAWTVHMQAETPYSLFATGSVKQQLIVGRVLYEHISHTDLNVFHSQVSREKGSATKSLVKSESADIPRMFSTFYNQSEQLGIKTVFFENSDNAAALVAMPGYDEEWFAKADPVELFSSIAELDHKIIKQCSFRFACDCSPEKLLPFFRAVDEESLQELYGEDEILIIRCPRCGRTFEIAKSEIRRD